FDFDKKVEEFVESKAAEHNVKVLWWDMHGEHEHLQANAHKYKKHINPASCTNRYKVTITAEKVKYGGVRSSIEQPSVVYTQSAHNGQPSSPQELTIKREIRREKTATWHTEWGFHSSFSVSVEAGIPDVAKFGSQFETSLDLKTGRTKQHSEAEIFSVNQVVNVPPMKTVKVEWIITDTQQEIPWTAKVNAHGWIAMWFEYKVNGHWLWFYPVDWLQDPLLTNVGGNTVQFTAQGVFTAVNAQETHLRVTESDLQEHSDRPSIVNIYTIPLNGTQ
ncbi:unnamed protein product, partial [Ixodes hexagonus]